MPPALSHFNTYRIECPGELAYYKADVAFRIKDVNWTSGRIPICWEQKDYARAYRIKLTRWHKNLAFIFIFWRAMSRNGVGIIGGVGTMDKIQFNNLSVSDQACLLLDGGDLLTTNCYYHYNVLLYNYENQFMELVYDNRAKQVLLVRVVNDNILQKYLDNIHLDL